MHNPIYHQNMSAEEKTDLVVARIAAAIGEAARVRILYSLLDGRARTATELSVVADVSPSTASAHLNRLKKEHLVKVHVQGKHRYYSLEGSAVADVLEHLSIIAGSNGKFGPNTPSPLRSARTCYDHMAGALGVLLHNRLKTLGWLAVISTDRNDTYELTSRGIQGMEALGIDVSAIREQRRRFAFACIDWSERQPHIGGALGAAIFKIALKRKWVVQEPDSRALTVTRYGRREMLSRFGLKLFD
jgi:DNA-binding transcriptional ArsR family regulator